MNDNEERQLRALTPIDLKKKSGVGGLSCPKCGSFSVMHHKAYWVRFGKGFIAFALAELILQVVSALSDEANVFGNVLELVSLALAGYAIYLFFAAIFGSNKCKDCNHRWYSE